MSEPVPVRRGRGERTPAVGRGTPDIWEEPFRELEDLWERMGRLFDPGWSITRGGAWQPMVDIEETEDAYVYEIDLPGAKREDITVEVRDHDLWITGELKEKERTGIVRRQTRRTGSFTFRSTLPSAVDTSKVKAKLESGVLAVHVAKSEKSKPQRIEVK